MEAPQGRRAACTVSVRVGGSECARGDASVPCRRGKSPHSECDFWCLTNLSYPFRLSFAVAIQACDHSFFNDQNAPLLACCINCALHFCGGAVPRCKLPALVARCAACRGANQRCASSAVHKFLCCLRCKCACRAHGLENKGCSDASEGPGAAWCVCLSRAFRVMQPFTHPSCRTTPVAPSPLGYHTLLTPTPKVSAAPLVALAVPRGSGRSARARASHPLASRC